MVLGINPFGGVQSYPGAQIPPQNFNNQFPNNNIWNQNNYYNYNNNNYNNNMNDKNQNGMSDTKAVKILQQYASQIDTAAGIGGQDGKMSMKDINAILTKSDSKNYPPELKEAAQYLKDNPSLLNSLDTADKTKKKGPDGKFGTNDLNAWLQQDAEQKGASKQTNYYA